VFTRRPPGYRRCPAPTPLGAVPPPPPRDGGVERGDHRAAARPLDVATRRLDLRPHRAGPELSLLLQRAELGHGDLTEPPLGRRAEVHGDALDVGEYGEDGGVELLGEQGAREVLVDDRLDPPQGTASVVDHRDAATAVGDDDRPVVEQQLDRRPVDARQRLRRGDHASPAPLTLGREVLAVGLAPADVRLVGQVRPDRFGRVLPGGVVQRDLDPADNGDHGPFEPADPELVGERVRDREPDRGLGLGHAPVERDRRHDVACQLVLDQHVAHLRPVAVGQHQFVEPLDHELGHLRHGAPHVGGLLARRPGGPGRCDGVAAERDDGPLPHLASSRPDAPVRGSDGRWRPRTVGRGPRRCVGRVNRSHPVSVGRHFRRSRGGGPRGTSTGRVAEETRPVGAPRAPRCRSGVTCPSCPRAGRRGTSCRGRRHRPRAPRRSRG
jgi:hypothetical protein